MKQKISIVLLLALLLGCSSLVVIQNVGFELVGKTNGLIDGTKLELFDVVSEEVIDSTVVINNRFELHGQLVAPPNQVILRTKDWSQYRFLWLENKTMTFDASETDFKNARFKGSEIHEWANEVLFSKTDTIAVINRDDLNRVREIQMQFVEEFPNNMISASILSVYATVFPRERIEVLYNELNKEYQESVYGKKVRQFLELNLERDLEVGDHYVDFEMKGPNGAIKKLSNHLKEVTLIEFWASNCLPCRIENPHLVKTYERFHDVGFEIFAVSLDTKLENWKNAISKDELPWIHVSDLEGQLNTAALTYGVKGIPDNFLIDKNGHIIAKNLRGEKLNKKLEKMLIPSD